MALGVIDAGGPRRTAAPDKAVRWSDDAPRWAWAAAIALLGLTLLREAFLALELAPLHFDEAQYWTYGEALDWGYYSKPPMVAWLIRASTEVFGDTIFGVRALAPWIQAWIAWLIFATARRLFDARTGFWAAIVYATLPGVSAAAAVMTTDPPMMAAWALALYALVRAMVDAPGDPRASAAAPRADFRSSGGGRIGWWLLAGAAIGLGLLSKYTIVAFLGGALGYAAFSRPGRWGGRPASALGPLAMLFAAALVWSPNLIWNAQNDFASIAHVGDNARLSGGPQFNFDKMAEFVGAQIGIGGPVVWAAFLWAIWRGDWRHEWSGRLLLWLAAPLPIAMAIQAFLSRAHPNWAAPAYIAMVILTVAFLLDRDRRSWAIASIAIGLAALAGGAALAAGYAAQADALPRVFDPFKKMRHPPEICERVGALRVGDEPVVSPHRELLAVCMFELDLGFDAIRIWPSGPTPGNHYELTSSLTAADQGPAIIAFMSTPDLAAGYLELFGEYEILEEGAIRTHGDREEPYFIARFRGLSSF